VTNHPEAMLQLLEARQDRPVIGVMHRAAGSSSVYFGPFENLAALQAWEVEHDTRLFAILLVDPDSPEDEWWYW
jgi:phosphatidylethanolamine-binding protein (PEBP) family uncharacterized protein